jgi:hypothetical protein
MKITKPRAASVLAVTLAVAAGATPASASTAKRAQTPSGTISCVARDYGDPGWSLTCSAEDPGTTMRISTAGHAYAAAYQPIARRGTVLRYGHSYDLGPFRCTSSTYGLDCSTVSRDAAVVSGFWLSRESAYAY